MDVTGNEHSYFHVTATDFNGNEGQEASIAPVVAASEMFVPVAYALAPIRPNPFSTMTTIRFDIADPGALRLEVFDVSGRLVVRLVDEPRPAGRFDLVWDGRDQAGHAVAGLYFVRLEAGDFTATRKLVLLK
jgi:hypothetical protein